jgi:hypothetical protein
LIVNFLSFLIFFLLLSSNTSSELQRESDVRRRHGGTKCKISYFLTILKGRLFGYQLCIGCGSRENIYRDVSGKSKSQHCFHNNQVASNFIMLYELSVGLPEERLSLKLTFNHLDNKSSTCVEEW